MKITARVEYACQAIFELALRGQNDRIQAREIAERQQIPLKFLEQILIQLKNAGLVTSIRGAGGGYLLGRPPSQIRLKDIMEAVEGEVSLIDPRLKRESTVLKVWREIEEEFLSRLESVTVEDLVKRRIREDQVIVYHI